MNNHTIKTEELLDYTYETRLASQTIANKGVKKLLVTHKLTNNEVIFRYVVKHNNEPHYSGCNLESAIQVYNNLIL